MGLEWIGKIGEFLVDLIPWPHWVRPDEEENVFLLGLFHYRRRRWLVLRWRLIARYETVPTNLVTVDVPEQFVTTRDGYCVGIRSFLSYRITDTKLYAVASDSWDEFICGSARQFVFRRAARKDIGDLRDYIEEHVGDALQARLSRYGIKVIEYGITDMIKTRHHGHWQSVSRRGEVSQVYDGEE